MRTFLVNLRLHGEFMAELLNLNLISFSISLLCNGTSFDLVVKIKVCIATSRSFTCKLVVNNLGSVSIVILMGLLNFLSLNSILFAQHLILSIDVRYKVTRLCCVTDLLLSLLLSQLLRFVVNLRHVSDFLAF